MLIFMRLAYCFFILFFSFFSLVEGSIDRRPPCYKDLERHFFENTITTNAFSLYSIRQSSWSAMVRLLQQRSQNEVPRLTWKEGQKIQPNPLDTVFKKGPAGEILGRVLFDLFSSVCKDYDITSNVIIKDMFTYIETQQASKIKTCIGRETFAPKNDEDEPS